jgi:2-keto-4-pentenoate hydratase/2-oxohepta-3-ene-1,7-dioic acid hydratase in catechol pathway
MNLDKIICFGKNYEDHCQEIGEKKLDQPVIFIKPSSCLVQAKNWSDHLQISRLSSTEHLNDLNYECEVVLKLATGGYKMSPEEAKLAISHYSIGLDMTLRQLQRNLKENGHPWTVAKVFPNSAIIGPWIECTYEDLADIQFALKLNGELKQNSQLQNMILNPQQLVQYASNFFQLCPGDIIFTGTPAGIGQLISPSSVELCLDKKILNINFL